MQKRISHQPPDLPTQYFERLQRAPEFKQRGVPPQRPIGHGQPELKQKHHRGRDQNVLTHTAAARQRPSTRRRITTVIIAILNSHENQA